MQWGMGIADDAEGYMDAPNLGGGKGGGGGDSPSFIASLLDLLGVHKQVAAGGDGKAARTTNSNSSQASSQHAEMVKPLNPVGDQIDSAGGEAFRISPIKAVDLPPSNRPQSRLTEQSFGLDGSAFGMLDEITNGLKMK